MCERFRQVVTGLAGRDMDHRLSRCLRGPEKSRKFAAHYRRVARERGCAFLDMVPVITSSNLDGIHLEPEEHGKLGRAVAEQVREILG